MGREPDLPFVSVIVPVYNSVQTVVQYVDSLLAQDYPKDRLEIIFVDNKSKDHTYKPCNPMQSPGKSCY
jgi:poly-beta-1,6-N-acetyl-D-glucosamine synthase